MRNASSCFQFSKKMLRYGKHTHLVWCKHNRWLLGHTSKLKLIPNLLLSIYVQANEFFIFCITLKNCNMTLITQLKCIRQLLALSFPGHSLVSISGNFQRRISRRRTTPRVIPNCSKHSERKYPFHLILLPESSAEWFNIFLETFQWNFRILYARFKRSRIFFADWKAPHVIEVFVSYLPCRSNAWQTVEDLPRYSARTYKKENLLTSCPNSDKKVVAVQYLKGCYIYTRTADKRLPELRGEFHGSAHARILTGLCTLSGTAQVFHCLWTNREQVT